MKFTCEKSALQREIAFAQEIISSKSSISVLSNVLFIAKEGSLFIKATDIKVNFETVLPVDVAEEGTVTIYCDKFLTILSSIPEGDIEIMQDDNKVVIRPVFKKIKFQLKSIASEKFPELPSIAENMYFSLPARMFKEMIANTIFAVSDDETRYFMNGVHMEKTGNDLIMVATDGRRLAYIKKNLEVDVPDFKGIIIPPKILGVINKHAGDENPISMAISEKNIFFRFANYSISSVLIEGQFPNYQRVIPEEQKNSMTIKRSELIDSLKRISILVEQKSRRSFLTLKSGEIIVSTEEGEIGAAREEIDCNYEGPEVTMALNYRYLEDPLKVMDSELVEISFTEPTKAMTLNAVPKRDYFHIVMPMQIE